MIAVLDTNVLVRGSISHRTVVATIIDAWLDGAFTLAVSSHLLDEVSRTLQKPYFATRLGAHRAGNYFQFLSLFSTLGPITAQV